MADGRITKRTVDALKPSAAIREMGWRIEGLWCSVRPSGAKSFIAFYRTGGRSPQRKVTIGGVGKIEVEKAREAARRILARAELGQDHAAKKQ